MVKGVNKTVIEVSNTGSRMFEKIVFYVTPQYGNLDPAKLQRAASELSFKFDEKGTYTPPLRERCKKRKRKRIGLACAIIASALGLLLLCLLL